MVSIGSTRHGSDSNTTNMPTCQCDNAWDFHPNHRMPPLDISAACVHKSTRVQPLGLWLFVHWRCYYSSLRVCDYSSPCDYPQFFGRTASAPGAKCQVSKQGSRRTRQSISQPLNEPQQTVHWKMCFTLFPEDVFVFLQMLLSPLFWSSTENTKLSCGQHQCKWWNLVCYRWAAWEHHCFLRIVGWVDTHTGHGRAPNPFNFSTNSQMFICSIEVPENMIPVEWKSRMSGGIQGKDWDRRFLWKPPEQREEVTSVKDWKANQRRHCGSKTWYRATLLGSLCKSSIKQKEDVTRFKGKSIKTELDTKQ